MLAGGDGYEMPELMTVDQVAELVRLNRQTIYNWIDAGTLEAMHIGRRVRIKRTVVDEMVKAGASRGQRYAPSVEDFWLGTAPVGEPLIES